MIVVKDKAFQNSVRSWSSSSFLHLFAQELNSFILLMPWANCGIFIAGLVIRKNIMGISTFKHSKQSISSVSTRKHAVSIPDFDKIPRKKAALHLGSSVF